MRLTDPSHSMGMASAAAPPQACPHPTQSAA